MIFDLVVDVIVDPGGFFLGRSLVDDALDPWNGQRNDGISDAMLVGELDPLIGDRLDLTEIAIKVMRSDVKFDLLATALRPVRSLVTGLMSVASSFMRPRVISRWHTLLRARPFQACLERDRAI